MEALPPGYQLAPRGFLSSLFFTFGLPMLKLGYSTVLKE
jgi:hypothetical protein